MAHLAKQEAKDRVKYGAEAGFPSDLPRVQVGARQQDVVVQHLLEVRNSPLAIDGVAVESSADLVVDAAIGHGSQRVARNIKRHAVFLCLSAAQKELDRQWLREEGRASPAAMSPVVGPGKALGGRVRQVRVKVTKRPAG